VLGEHGYPGRMMRSMILRTGEAWCRTLSDAIRFWVQLYAQGPPASSAPIRRPKNEINKFKRALISGFHLPCKAAASGPRISIPRKRLRAVPRGRYRMEGLNDEEPRKGQDLHHNP
jgi:hypothetical protein